ncbi:Polyketide cyclase / dehydrase and lipid transport [Roseibium alexandrii]|uniref:Polyketide cyclase / dehydrase and lipid transport n=2 Tax=Roseibium alexandrii TaxID=388408 RepID=A0A0M7AKW6_9HYPH|nr:Polyketide cyclase / dehydrase and lipid transport [Roseibium alexandrii]
MITLLKIGGGVLLVLAGVLLVLSFTGKKTFRTEVFIPVPPEAVWDVLMDTASYPDWNPTFIQVQGEYKEGVKVTNTVKTPDGTMTINASVQVVIPKAELRQAGGLPGVITFDHRWLLRPENGGTCVIQHEIDRGFYLWFWNSDWVQPAYERASLALKHRVSGTGEPTGCRDK